MESSEGGDDQGSGWLQVKKKHRCSSRFSLHGWVGGSSGKQDTKDRQTQPLFSVKCEAGKNGGQTSKGSVVPNVANATNPTTLSKNDTVVHYFDKCVVNQNNESTKVLDPVNLDVKDSNHKAGLYEEHPQTENLNVIPRIKFGDLDDGSLILHHEDSDGAPIQFGRIENHNLTSKKAGDADSLLTTVLSSETNESNPVGTIKGRSHVLQESHPLSQGNEAVENEVYKDVNEVLSENAIVNVSKENIVGLDGDVLRSLEDQEYKNMNTDTNRTLSYEHIASEDTSMNVVPSVNEASSSETSISHGSLSTIMNSPVAKVLPSGNNEAESPMAPATSSGDFKFRQGDLSVDNLSKTQIINSTDAYGIGESKERFRQRLWCFLFENLNRAVDELYLLCELECDLEQMKEAILVLEEASSDFQELKSRVEEFEKLKRSTPYVVDEASLTMKSDHRRPHALSWEVRRMTTSPRRAEILSSSLEAFRKIQQERARLHANDADSVSDTQNCTTTDISDKCAEKSDFTNNSKEPVANPRKQTVVSDLPEGSSSKERKIVDSGRSNSGVRRSVNKEGPSSVTKKSKKELLEGPSEMTKLVPKKEKILTEIMIERNTKSMDHMKKHITLSEREKEKLNLVSLKSMDAWKEKRNWEDILAPSYRVSSRFSHSPGLSRKSAERARVLHDKLMSPDKKKKKSAVDLKREAEEKHARAMRIRNELENERVQKLQRNSEKLKSVNVWQAERSMKLRELMYARHQRSESRHEAFIARVVRRAGDESSKVNEVRFITSLNEENKKLMLRQKLHDSELRRAEKLQVLKTKQKEDLAREEAVLERKKLIEAEKLQRLAETQRKKEEAQIRREEERKASSAAREAKAIEQLRRKEIRAKAQQEEAELLAQKLAERLRESEQRRKYYLEQIRERASMDFRDQSSPLLRRSANKEDQGKSTVNGNGEDYQVENSMVSADSALATGDLTFHSLKRRIKRIRQRLMALKYEFPEPSIVTGSIGVGYRTTMGSARAKIGRWLQELQKLRQARKEGAASFGLITAEMIKFLEGKDAELQASRQAGLLDFIASALPASHTSKPEACQVTIYLLRLLRVVLSVPANRSYFLAQNLLPPIIPMLAAALENYIKMAASSNIPNSSNLLSSEASSERMALMSEILDGFLWTVAAIIVHVCSDDRQLQMQDGLLELIIAYQVIHRLRDLFALYDRPQVEGSPFPPSILLSINLLEVLTCKFRNVSLIDLSETIRAHEAKEFQHLGPPDSNSSSSNVKEDYGMLLPEINSNVAVPLPDVPEDRPLGEYPTVRRNGACTSSDKNSVKLDSINTKTEAANDMDGTEIIMIDETSTSFAPLKDDKDAAISTAEKNSKIALKQPASFLLSAISETGLVCLPSMLTAVLLQANNRSSEQASFVLPFNFEEVANGVLKVLNNLALIDITFIQQMLARPDLKMEFFHLTSFLLSYCTGKWGIASDKTGLLLLETLLLLGYFALFHSENQAVLRWGKSPTILHKVCDLPFVFFSDPDLMPVLAGTLVAACFGCEQNKVVIQEEISMDMLVSLLRSCTASLPVHRSNSTLNMSRADDPGESSQVVLGSKKLHLDAAQRSNRCNVRNTRALNQKVVGGTNRAVKTRNQRDNKVIKHSEESSHKHNQSVPVTTAIMLYHRFPDSFIRKAEQFFSAEPTSLDELEACE